MLSPEAYQRLRPILFRVPAERAHRLTIRALRSLPSLFAAPPPPPILKTRVCGLDFASPIGLAAGFDKDAEVPAALLRAGFGFVEVGTITPLPQAGNPKPRVFRLPADGAVINRLGFNNGGHGAALGRLEALSAADRVGPLGVNVGANKDSEDRVGDYVTGIRRFAHVADYFTINISSPNTPGLRALQDPAALDDLLSRVVEARTLTDRPDVPLWLKVAPDLAEADQEEIARLVLKHELDGLVVSNTTVARPAGLVDPQQTETGGLSGRPLMEPSTSMLRRFRQMMGAEVPLIGVGGVASGADAYAKLRAGASLVQLYTGLVYGGPGLVARINDQLADLLRRDGLAGPAEAVGLDA